MQMLLATDAPITVFEPNPMNYRFLMANLEAAGCAHRVTAFNRGVSSDGRTLSLCGSNSIDYSFYRSGSYGCIRMRTISTDRLFHEQYLGRDAGIDLLKARASALHHPSFSFPGREGRTCAAVP